MVRVLKPGGFMYLNAPSTGYYHGHPVDCWRFYIDSWMALTEWEPQALLIQSYLSNAEELGKLPWLVDIQQEEFVSKLWQDSVGIYTKKINDMVSVLTLKIPIDV